MDANSEEVVDIVGNASNEVGLVEEISTPKPTSSSNLENGDISGLSKRQLRLKRKHDTWIQNLPAKRLREKLKLKQKRLELRANNLPLGPSRKCLKATKMSTSKCKVRVAIDMSFDHLMTDKDIAKCTKQILRCYSANRRAGEPMQLYVTSFGGKTEAAMEKHWGFRNWDVNFTSKSIFEVFKIEELVYLSSESENVLREVDDTKVYIIGGLVDHNTEKGHCHELAKMRGVAHAQLPIGEYMQMKSRRVLAINHVYEILLGISDGNTWQEAFMRTLPLRKGATVKPEPANEEVDKEPTQDLEGGDLELKAE